MKVLSYTIFTILLLLASCQKEQVLLSPEDVASRDSLALHVGVVPVSACLPIYFAMETGMFQDEGVDVRLHEFLSQMDCDTALQNNCVHVAFTDLPRLLEMQGEAAPYRSIASINAPMSLIMAKKLRIRNLKHLDERMIALDRLSASDYWSDEIMREAGLSSTAIYRPQINNVQLRTRMLTEQMTDGAILPEPYATEAEMLGHKRLFTSDTTTILFCLASTQNVLTDTMRNAQVRKFMNTYNKAVSQLNNGTNPQVLRDLITKQYGISPQIADSLQLTTIYPLSLTRETDADKAMTWMRKRERRITSKARTQLLWSEKLFSN